MRNKVLGIVFLCIIIIIPVFTVICRVSIDEGEQVQEEKPENVFGMVDAFLEDVPVREAFAKFNTKFTRKITGSGYINSTQVMLGKNDWLFLKATQADYEHINCFTEAEKAQILTQLLAQRDTLANVGIEFVIYIPPNKATVYPENMPDTIVQTDSLSRAEDLIDYIRANSDLTVIYPKDELIAAKNISPVYYVTDTHWNDVGAYIGTQVFLEEMFGFRDKLLPEMITLKKQYREGDLSRIGGVADIYRENEYYSIYDSVMNPALNIDKKVYFVGDSFREAMMYYLKYYINDVSTVHYENFNFLDMYEYRPDIVVWEVVERNIHKYLELSIIGSTAFNGEGMVKSSAGEIYYLPNDAFKLEENGVRYLADGEYQTEALIEADGLLFYFDENGYMLSGVFKEIGEHIYYFSELGMAKNGWVENNGIWYYFDENYHMVKDAWVETEAHEWFYMTGDGSMLTDAYTPDGYYVNENGQWLQ